MLHPVFDVFGDGGPVVCGNHRVPGAPDPTVPASTLEAVALLQHGLLLGVRQHHQPHVLSVGAGVEQAALCWREDSSFQQLLLLQQQSRCTFMRLVHALIVNTHFHIYILVSGMSAFESVLLIAELVYKEAYLYMTFVITCNRKKQIPVRTF